MRRPSPNPACRSLALLGGLLAACSNPPPPSVPGPDGSSAGPNQVQRTSRTARRVVILAFDGVDPDLVDRWAARLPVLGGLMGGQPCPRLTTTLPPDDAVAWTTFATSRLPAAHGVLAATGRDPVSHLPRQDLFRYIAPGFDPGGNRIREAGAETLRRGDSFWKTAGAGPVKVKVLFAPYVFPPETVSEPSILSGLGAPDLRFSWGTWSLLDTRLTPAQAAVDPDGGDLVALSAVSGSPGVYKGVLTGPPTPSGEAAVLGLTVSSDAAAGTVTVNGGGAEATLPVGRASEWLGVTFPGTGAARPRGVLRFLPLEAEKGRIRILVSPLYQEPREPYVPFSTPMAWSRYMAESYGLFPSAEGRWEVSARGAGLLDDEQLQSLLSADFQQRVRMTVGELKKGDADLLVSWFGAPDAASHAWFGEALDAPVGLPPTGGADRLLQVYRWVDDAVGQVQATLSPQDVLVVLSAHGFQPFRSAFGVNAWLLEHGYLVSGGGVRKGRQLQASDVDWSRSRAWSVGNGLVYLNLAGREANGTVEPAEREALIAEIAAGFAAARDPRSGEVPVHAARTRQEAWPSVAGEVGPDLILSFEDGWQASLADRSGQVSAEIWASNRSSLGGDHAGSRFDTTDGFVLANLPGLTRGMWLEDVGTTALARLGVPPAEGTTGRDMVTFFRDRGALAPDVPRLGAPLAPASSSPTQEPAP